MSFDTVSSRASSATRPGWVDDAADLRNDGLSIAAVARRLKVDTADVERWTGWRCPQCRIPYRRDEPDLPGRHFCVDCRRTWLSTPAVARVDVDLEGAPEREREPVPA